MDVRDKIDEITAKFVEFFTTEVRDCKNDIDHFNLIISMLVFNNLIHDYFDENFKKDNSSELELKEMKDFLQRTADDISEKVLFRLEEEKLKLFN